MLRGADWYGLFKTARYEDNYETAGVPQVSRFSRPGIPQQFEFWDRLQVTDLSCLLCGDRIKFAGRLLIEQRALFRISAAPVLLSTGNTQETARPYALFTGVVLVQISALHHDDRNICLLYTSPSPRD